MDQQRPGANKDWRHQARCVDYNPELFYPVAAEHTVVGAEQRAEAKAVCYQCPVREECLELSFEWSNDYGIWGGLTESERKAEKRKRSRRAKRQVGAVALQQSSASHPVTRKMRPQDRTIETLSVPGLEI